MSRFFLGFTRGKKDWYQKKGEIERKLEENKAFTYPESHLNIQTEAEKFLLLFKYIFCFQAILATWYVFK